MVEKILNILIDLLVELTENIEKCERGEEMPQPIEYYRKQHKSAVTITLCIRNGLMTCVKEALWL